MKYPLIILALLISTNLMLSQDLDKHKFVNATILNVRSEPNKESKVIGKLKKNTLVKVISQTNKYEEINGIKSNWKKIQFEKTEGFVFSGYLSENSIIHTQSDTFDIVFDMYYDLEYNPNLNWYGVFSTSKGEEIKSITPNPHINKPYEDLTGISFVEDTSMNYSFFIGTTTKIDSGIIGVKKYFDKKWLRENKSYDLFLFNDNGDFSIGHKLKSKMKKDSNGIYGEKSFKDYKLHYINYEKNRYSVIYSGILTLA